MEAENTAPADAVAAIFVEAGWAPGTKDGWGGKFVWTDGLVVGGIDPWGTPRATGRAASNGDIEEAAAWLIEHAKDRAPVILTTDATLAPPAEPEHDSAHEGDGETGEEADGAVQVLDADSVSEDGAGDNPLGEWFDYETTGDAGGGGGDVPLDADFADFADLPELGQELAEEHPEEHASGAFIFGDNLDQKRTAAIGLVMQAAIARMPPWNDTDTARLSELRNFAMGVSEGRWNDDTGSREWLNELETRLRRRSQIVSHRDGLVEFLNTALHPDLDAFDPNQGWPE